jgi:hypothetical protein
MDAVAFERTAQVLTQAHTRLVRQVPDGANPLLISHDSDTRPTR